MTYHVIVSLLMEKSPKRGVQHLELQPKPPVRVRNGSTETISDAVAKVIAERVRKGIHVEFPSLGIVIEPKDLVKSPEQ